MLFPLPKCSQTESAALVIFHFPQYIHWLILLSPDVPPVFVHSQEGMSNILIKFKVYGPNFCTIIINPLVIC